MMPKLVFTESLTPGMVVVHPRTDKPVTVKSVSEVPHLVDRYDVRFEEDVPLVLDKHKLALWRHVEDA